MKKIIIALLATVLAFLPATSTKASSTLLNGQKQYYTVQLRSDKRAVVYARIIFENASADQDMSTYAFSLPKDVTVENLSAQQILAKNTEDKPCQTYETIDQWRARVNKSTTYYQSDAAYNSARQCLVWGTAGEYDEDFDYDTNTSSSSDYYYYSYYQKKDSKFDYADLTQTNSGGDYSVTLSEPVKPKKQGSILVSFTTSNFVTGGFLGRYDYNVRTLLAKQMIDKTTVAVNFDSDMFTREATGKRTYETSSSASANLAAGADMANNAYQSKSTDNLVSSIGRGGLYVKSQASLLPGDTLSVTGVFGTNSVVLFSTEILIGILVIAALGIALWRYLVWRKKHPRKTASADSDTSTPTPTFNRAFQKLSDASSTTPWLSTVLASVISIVGTIVITLALVSSTSDLSSSSSTNSTLLAFGVIAVGVIGGLLAPALYMARFGVKSVFKWSLVHLGLIVVILLMFSTLNSAGLHDSSSGCGISEDCMYPL